MSDDRNRWSNLAGDNPGGLTREGFEYLLEVLRSPNGGAVRLPTVVPLWLWEAMEGKDVG